MLKKTKRAVLIPGSFNPVTKAHLLMGEQARSLFPDADVWFVPASSDYILKKTKNEAVFSEKDRYEMLKLCTRKRGFLLSNIEMRGVVSGKTYDTAAYFKNELCYDEIIICIGYDNLEQLKKWHRIAELIKEAKFLVFERNGQSICDCKEPLITNNAGIFTGTKSEETFGISSTIARESIAKEDYERLSIMLEPEVVNYIVKMKEVQT